MRNARWILLAFLVAGCMSHKEIEDRKVLQAGYGALGQADYDTALAASDQFLHDNPNGGPGTPEALYLHGRVYEHNASTADAAGRLPEARADLQTARQTYEHALTLSPAPKVAALIHAGVAIPQTELLKSVWGPEHGNDFEYLRTYVGQLRKKIEDDPLKPQYIQTLPRIGYRFNLQQKEA